MKHFDYGKTVTEGSLLTLWMIGCGGLCERGVFSLLGVVYIEVGWRRQHGFLAFHMFLFVLVACWRCSLIPSIAKDSFTVPSCDPVLSFSRFDGRVVAKLPFIPLSYIQGLSHRNLLGEDYTDCSFIFLYILCTMSIRQVSTLLCLLHAWGRKSISPSMKRSLLLLSSFACIIFDLCVVSVFAFIPMLHIQSNSRLGS